MIYLHLKMEQSAEENKEHWRSRLFTVIFEHDTPAGKLFDIVLLVLIFLSLVLVMLQSIPELEIRNREIFYQAEWVITILFTIEYVLRLLAVKKPRSYATSFYGIIDILSIVPTYLSLFLPLSQYLLVIRSLRLMRVFRIFKLTQFVREGTSLALALKASARRILVFFAFVLIITIVMGSIVYVVESPVNERFSNIPQSIYWCIVTITTVGYGDIFPITTLGKFLASFIMLLGYAIIAVPTGIVTVELTKSARTDQVKGQACPSCSIGGHDPDAVHCKYCGHLL
jgi:voltage-gated potassium channel